MAKAKAKTAAKKPVKGNPVGWFEIPTTDLLRAKKFYEGVFGVKLSLQTMAGCEMAWFPMDGAKCYGATGALVRIEGYFKPSHEGTLVYFSVPAIKPALAKIVRRGGKTLMDKTSIGPHGFIAHFEDTEGNRVALHAMK